MLARIKANMRRVEVDRKENSEKHEQQELKIGALTIQPDKRKVLKTGKSISLTPEEFELLHLFAAHPGKAFFTR